MKEIIFLLNTTRFKLKHNVFLIILTLLLLYSCTSVQKTTQAKDQSSSAVPITTKQDSAQSVPTVLRNSKGLIRCLAGTNHPAEKR